MLELGDMVLVDGWKRLGDEMPSVIALRVPDMLPDLQQRVRLWRIDQQPIRSGRSTASLRCDSLDESANVLLLKALSVYKIRKTANTVLLVASNNTRQKIE